MEALGQKIRNWENAANTFPDMRYPLYNISLNSILSSEAQPYIQKVHIKLETFIQNEGGTRIFLLIQKYEYVGQYKDSMLKESLERFHDQCRLYKEKYIWTGRTSIREPFEFNK